jgi:hypothetical protein
MLFCTLEEFGIKKLDKKRQIKSKNSKKERSQKNNLGSFLEVFDIKYEFCSNNKIPHKTNEE